MNNKEPTHYCLNGNTESILDNCIVSSNIHELFDSFEVLKNDDMTSDRMFQLRLISIKVKQIQIMSLTFVIQEKRIITIKLIGVNLLIFFQNFYHLI
jgi:hypothetical protein